MKTKPSENTLAYANKVRELCLTCPHIVFVSKLVRATFTIHTQDGVEFKVCIFPTDVSHEYFNVRLSSSDFNEDTTLSHSFGCDPRLLSDAIHKECARVLNEREKLVQRKLVAAAQQKLLQSIRKEIQEFQSVHTNVSVNVSFVTGQSVSFTVNGIHVDAPANKVLAIVEKLASL